MNSSTSEAVIDLAAVTANVQTLKRATDAAVMAVVKADGYGHGLLPSADAALAGGAGWLGVALLSEAITLRQAGIAAPILAWLWTPSQTSELRHALAAQVDIAVSSQVALQAVVATAKELDVTARVHLKLDTGLSRNGITQAEWPDVVSAAVSAADTGTIAGVGLMSHFAYADAPGHPTIAAQIALFREGIEVADRLGYHPEVKHLANSAATLTLPEAHFDLVRPGVAIYGLSPVPDQGSFGLVPAMTLRSQIANVKQLAAGAGVSYGHVYHTRSAGTAVLVPMGYADGIPRAGTNVGPVSIGGVRHRVSGRVCMDQFVVDVGDQRVHQGDEVIIFGSGADGEPTAQDWANAVDTIHYEIVTRLGPRVPRVYINERPVNQRPVNERPVDKRPVDSPPEPSQ